MSLYFNVRNILPKSGTFPTGHSVRCYYQHDRVKSSLERPPNLLFSAYREAFSTEEKRPRREPDVSSPSCAEFKNRVQPCLHSHHVPSRVEQGQLCLFQARSRNCEKRLFSFVISARLSVYPHGTTRLRQGGFSRNLILFFENLLRKFMFIKIGQE